MQDIDNILLDAMNEHKIQAPTDAWPFIANALQKRKKRRIAWIFLTVFVVLLISAGSLCLYNGDFETKKETAKTVSFADNRNSINKNEKNREEEKVNEKITQKTVDTIFQNNKISSFKNTSFSSAINAETIFDKTTYRKKTKSRTSIKTIISLAGEEVPKGNTNLSDKQNDIKDSETISETISETYTTKTFPIFTEKAETPKIIIANEDSGIAKVAKETSIENSKEKQPGIKKENSKKWDLYVGISYGALIVSSKNLFGNENKNLNPNPSTFLSPTFPTNATNSNDANYQSGKYLSLSLLLKSKHKKFQPHLGFNLHMGSFNIQAYNASSAFLASQNLAIDSSQFGNSSYASRSTIGGRQIKVKNNFVQIGLVAGCGIPIFSFKGGHKVIAQAVVMPTYNVAQSIQWYDKTSTRYFTSKKMANDFNITQSTALLWQANAQKKTVLIGPFFNFNYFKLNRNVNNIATIYTQSIGVQFQMKLKK